MITRMELILLILFLTVALVVYQILLHPIKLRLDSYTPRLIETLERRRMDNYIALTLAIQDLDTFSGRRPHLSERSYLEDLQRRASNLCNTGRGCTLDRYGRCNHSCFRPRFSPRRNNYNYSARTPTFVQRNFGPGYYRPVPTPPRPDRPRPPSPPHHPRPPRTPSPEPPISNGPVVDSPPSYEELEDQHDLGQVEFGSTGEVHPILGSNPEEDEGPSGDEDLPELDKEDEDPAEVFNVPERPVIETRKLGTRKVPSKAKKKTRMLHSLKI